MLNRTMESPYTNIYMNLALEQSLARGLRKGERILLFWTDSPSVVFGRFQNPWSECRTELLAEAGILAARRYSGGGTVFHDPGNLNYAVITDRESVDIQGNLEILKTVIARQGAEVHIGPRRDLLMGPYKISGSAFQLHRDFGIHHGTLLIAADLDRMRGVLGTALDISDNRAVASVRSPVTNIGEITGITTVPEWSERIRAGFSDAWGGFSEKPLPLPDTPELVVHSEGLSQWDWIYGQTPAFVLTLPGEKPLRVRIEGGRIASVLSRDGPDKGLAVPLPLKPEADLRAEAAALLRTYSGNPADILDKQLKSKEDYHAI